MTAPTATDNVPGIAALRSDVAALGDALTESRAEVARLTGEQQRTRDELAEVRAQLVELVDFARRLDALGEQLGPMLDGLGSNPMLRALGIGGR